MDFKNILIVRADRMGDLVLTIPAIRALRKAYPAARLTLWASASTRALVDGLPFIDEIIAEDKSKGWSGYLKLLFTLWSRRFDLAVIYHTKQRTNVACFLAMIPTRLGYKNRKCGFLLTHPVLDERHFGIKHESEYCMDLLRAIGVDGQDYTLEVARQVEAETWADVVFAEQDLRGKTIIALHPSASCSSRFWPTDSFIALASRLVNERGVTIVMVGDTAVNASASAIRAAVGKNVVDLTGRTTLAQMVSVLRRCQLLVSNDSGPVHVAAAVGIPVISLFLRSQPGINPQRWRPLGPKGILICNKAGEEIKIDADSNVTSGRFDSIGVDDVFQKCLPFVSNI